MAEILFTRHAQPPSGHADPPLSAAGREQAAALGRWLTGEQVDVVIARPLARAPKPADIAARDMGLPITTSLDLREWIATTRPTATMSPLEDLGATNPR